MEIFMRKHYLDNIRFLTIFFVVIFHVYFYYNNIGTEAMFAGLKPYEGAVTFAGIYQYFVYPWFMLLLFVVAGISARYALEKSEEEHCSCEDGIFRSAFKHTLKIFAYILIISFLLNVVIGFIGEDTLAGFFTAMPLVGEAVAALVGLIPNCASSVVITELYLGGIIGAGAMMSGLLVNAGVGLLVLFRLNRDWKQNAGIVAALYGLGVFWGVIIRVCGIVF